MRTKKLHQIRVVWQLKISTISRHVLFFMNLISVSLISCSAYVYMKEHSTQYYQRTRNKGLLLPASIYRYTVMLLEECLRRRKSVLRVSIAGMIYEYWRHPAYIKTRKFVWFRNFSYQNTVFLLFSSRIWIIVSIKYIPSLILNRCLVRSIYK